MIFLHAKNDPNVVAQRFLDGLQHGQYKLGHETLKDLNATVTVLLAFVRNQMNTHAPIHALPTELLQLIFFHTLSPPNAFLPFDARGARADVRAETQRTLALTHVCRRWRNVALDTGALWTRVDAHAPGSPCAAAFLARSKAAALRVHAPFPASPFLRTTLASHAARLHSLTLTLPAEERSTVPSASGDDTAPALPFAAPNLELLVLTTECDPFDDRRPLLDLHAPSPLFLLGPAGGTPRLRRLLLRNMCWVPLVPLERLTHLFLTEGTSVPLPALLSFLGRCAALEVLVLADVYVDVAAAGGAHAPPPDQVALPRLRRCTLGIGGALLNMRRVLAHVVFPEDATVRVIGGRAFHALSHLQPFPDLAFARGLDTLSVDFAPHCAGGGSGGGCAGRSGGGGGGGGVVIRAAGSGTGRQPGLLLDFPTYRGTPAECELMRGLMRSLVPLERLVDVRYRVCAHQKEPMHVLGGEDVSLSALKRFRLVEGGCTHQGGTGTGTGTREAFGDAVRKALGRCPSLEEVGVWSEDSELPSRLAVDGRALSRMVVYRSGGQLTLRDEDEVAFRERAADVDVCRSSCTPSMKIPGTDIDWVDSPYEW
ncbi:hypothetical protein LXA43DRAFT_1137586 [Ganoderma leucocontextum]|nr:hypothetical protein LXA43DRAFT_1137586 [Ganoderma leucocontextum]